MSYDRDLRHARWWAFALGLCNLAAVAMHAYLHNWMIAVGSGFWALCCWLWLRIISAQQATRDMGRLIEAGLHGMRESIERGER